MDNHRENVRKFILGQIGLVFVLTWYYVTRVRPRFPRTREPIRYNINRKRASQKVYLKRLTQMKEVDCKNVLRMNKQAFRELVVLLKARGGLGDSKHVSIDEKLAIFLIVIGHHSKNRVAQFAFQRSGHTISIYFHDVLNVVLQLHPILLARPEPVPADCDEEPWRHFKGCIGALDGTYVDVMIRKRKQALYRKCNISVNVLDVVDRKMRFIYALTGWEGFAADGKVLREAILKDNGLKVLVAGMHMHLGSWLLFQANDITCKNGGVGGKHHRILKSTLI